MARSFDTGFSKGFGISKSQGYLALMIDARGGYEPGDIVSAVNRLSLRCVGAEAICQPRRHPRNSDGLSPIGELSNIYYDQVSKYKFERISQNLIRRTNLITLSFVEYGSTPIEDPDKPGSMIHCHVDEYFRRRKKHINHNIFGTSGSEVCYSNYKQRNHDIYDIVWQEIEQRTTHLEANHLVPTFDFRKRLVIAVDDFDDSESGNLLAPLYDLTDENNPVLVKKRQKWVDRSTLRDVIEADVINLKKVVRIDNIRKHVRSEIVNQKVI